MTSAPAPSASMSDDHLTRSHMAGPTAGRAVPTLREHSSSATSERLATAASPR